MAVKIELKRSAVPGKIPTTSSLELGEVAINTYDGKLFYKQDVTGSESIVEVATVSGSILSASYALYASNAGNAVSSSYAQNATSASQALNANNAVSSSYALNSTSASYAFNATSASYAENATSASYVLEATSASYANDATSASYSQTSSYADNFTVAGTLTAQKIVVQTISSSVVYSSGSNVFGDEFSDTQTFTGSVNITGSLNINGSDYINTSASFDSRILNNSSSIDLLSGSYLTSSASFDTRILNNSSSIGALSSSFLAFSSSYNTGSFTGSFTGSLFGTSSYALRALSSSYAETSSYATQFNVATALTASGLIYPTADNGEKSFIQTDGNGNLSLQYVETLLEPICNGESFQLDKGTPVYISGSQGANPIVYVADAANPNKMPVIYIVNENLPAGEVGVGILLGNIEGVDTTGYPSGTEIYVAPGGGWTSTRPTGSAIIQSLGIVTKEGNGGKGIVLNPGPANLPNIPSGYTWIGDSNNYPIATATSSIQNVISSSYAGFAETIADGLNITASNLYVTNNIVATSISATSASFEYVQSVTGSAVIIGQEYIILNTQTPSARFAGLQIYDSGSFSTASVVWDSERNHLVYQNASGSSYTGGGFMSGPRNTGSLGDEPYPSFNRVLRGQGGDHLYNSNIFDDNTTIRLEINTQVTGSLNVSNGITGSLFGTASFADNSTSSSYALVATSASYALNSTSASHAVNANNANTATSSSYALNSTTASYAVNATSSSYAFNSTSASQSDNANTATSASYALNSTNASQADNANTATSSSYALTSTSASYSNNSISASYALNSTSASYAETASFADTFVVSGDITGSNALFTGTITAQTLNVQTVSSSIIYSSGSNVFGDELSDVQQFTGSVNITGSLTVNGKNYLTDSASFDTRILNNSSSVGALSSSFLAFSSSYTTGSFTGSFTGNGSGLTNIPASSVVGLNLSQISSGSVTASVDPNLGFRVNANTTISGSTLISGSLTVTGSTNLYGEIGTVLSANVDTLIFTGSVSITGSLEVNNSSVILSNQTSSMSVLSASYANNSTTASYALNATTSSYALNATSASYAEVATTSSYALEATSASYAFNSTSASYALTASYAMNGGGGGISAITMADEGVLQGTASYFDFVGEGVTLTVTDNTASINIPATISASYATNALSASYATTSISASYASTSSHASNFTIESTLNFSGTLTDYASVASSVAGSNNLFTQPTASYTSAFFKYTVSNGGNARSGEIIAVWNGTTVEFTDNSTVDIGSTTPVTSSVAIVGGDLQFNMQTNTSGWRIKSISTFM